MKKDYKLFKVHRLFKEDTKLILDCYSDYDFLHFNPVNEKFVDKVFIYGSFWRILDGDTTVALTWMLPFENEAVPEYAKWEIEDLLGLNPKETMICGYIWINQNYKDRNCTDALAKLWSMTGYRKNMKNVIHYAPAHVEIDFESLFKNNFELVGLRGLDKLVPHYIFIENNKTKEKIKEKEAPLTDTKEISKLCENGYKGYEITTYKNILFRR